MKGLYNYIISVFKGIKTLVDGMRVTGYYFFHPKEIVTQQYPENRDTLKMFDRFRGEVIMPHNKKNEHSCTGCGICELNCPNGSIEVISKTIEIAEGKKKRVLDKHIYHLGMCTFCNLCVKSCPSGALAMSQKFEHAVWDRAKLIKVLNQPGSQIIQGVKE
jgi:NADH-quinone oxidoreductase subunit I